VIYDNEPDFRPAVIERWCWTGWELEGAEVEFVARLMLEAWRLGREVERRKRELGINA
jgi:hypothetical protein